MSSPAGSRTVTTGTWRPLPWGPLYENWDGDDWDDSVVESYEIVEPSLVRRTGPKGREGFSVIDVLGVELDHQQVRLSWIMIFAHDVYQVSMSLSSWE
jgi:hypothetical protein